MFTQSLADAAVRGEFQKAQDEKRELLSNGDIAGLMAVNRRQYGGFFMGPDDDDDDDTGDGGDDDGNDDDGDDDDDDDDKGNKSKKSKEALRIEQLEAENKRRRLKARQQDAANKALQKELEDAKKGKPKSKDDDDDDDSDKGKTAQELAEAQAKIEEGIRTNEDLLIRLEFTTNTKFKWKNPKAALRLLDLADVEVTDDGEVEGLDEAIAALAKSDPYLLEDSKDDDDEDEEDAETKRRKRSTGQKTGTRKKGNPNRDKLLNKYPALRR